MAFFVWDSPRGRLVRELDRAVVILGRDPVADFRLDDPTVSRRHALVQVDGETVRVTDLDSTTGTRINGARLSPQVPSTLQPGDFLQLGKVVLTFHVVAPPAVPPPASPAAPVPPGAARARPAPVPERPFPWKWVALGLAFVLVGLAGALVAIQLTARRERPPPVAATEPAPEEPTPPAPPATGPDAPSDPPPAEPAPPAGPERAPPGEMPPRRAVPADDYPDLLEIEHGSYLPVRLVDFGGATVEALGADGRVYALPRGKVTKIEDRADLARRATLRRMGLERDDVEGRLELARWCRTRMVLTEARTLVEEVLALRPADEEALRLKAWLQGEE